MHKTIDEIASFLEDGEVLTIKYIDGSDSLDVCSTHKDGSVTAWKYQDDGWRPVGEYQTDCATAAGMHDSY